MKSFTLFSLILTLLGTICLSSCVIPGIQQTVSCIDYYHVSKKSSVKTPHELVVYALDGRYYMEVELLYTPVTTCMFYFEFITDRTKGICVTGSDKRPVKKFLAKLSDTDVFHILQRKVEQPGDDSPELIDVNDFDFERATRCSVNPVKFKYPADKQAHYSYPEYYYPRIERFAGGTLHTLMRPVAWAAWGVEIPLFVASNTFAYTIYLPYRVIKVKVLGIKD